MSLERKILNEEQIKELKNRLTTKIQTTPQLSETISSIEKEDVETPMKYEQLIDVSIFSKK